MSTKELSSGNDLKSRIAGLSAEKRALLEQKLLEKRARVPEEKEIPRRGSTDPVVPSFCQQRLWFLDQLAPGTSTYNVPNLWKIEGRLDRESLRKSFEDFIQRHEVL